MATTPHADPPKNDKAKSSAPAPKGKEGEDDPPRHPTLKPEDAVSLFRNGHRIAKDGDPQEKWISMSRAPDGVAVVQTLMTDAIVETIKTGSYYLVEDQGTYFAAAPAAPAATAPPTNVDVPHVSATGANATCTMGNWNGEPTSYAYAWRRDGAPISGAASANYTMVAADSGKPIGCIVTATNAGGSTAAPISNTVTGPSAR